MGVKSSKWFKLPNGKPITLCRLDSVCNGNSKRNMKDLDDGMMIIGEAQGCHTAIHVDGIEGRKQILPKDIERPQCDSEMFMGGAVMGDDRVAMVGDMD